MAAHASLQTRVPTALRVTMVTNVQVRHDDDYASFFITVTSDNFTIKFKSLLRHI